jgi:DNA-binding LacI/PurR family transcriptional regulator
MNVQTCIRWEAASWCLRGAGSGSDGVASELSETSGEVGVTPDATILDVAELAGVSRQTVSNVLNAPERVRPETQERVRLAIDELGYHPSRSARNLRARSTKLLAYRVAPARSGALNVVLDRFLHALTDTARDRGYQILLFTSPAGQPELSAYEDLLRTKTVDGFVLSESNYRDPRVEYLFSRGAPFSVFGRCGLDVPHRWVDVDNAAGTRQAVEHLLSAGRRRIAFLGWPEGSVTGDARARGYREALEAAGIEPAETLDHRGSDDLATGRAAAERWLELDTPPDGVVAASDLLAIGVLQVATEQGLQVGRDLRVTGFDDTPTAAALTPPLTSVRQPIEEVAAHIIRQLIESIGGEAVREGALLAPRLIVRRT